MVFQAELSLIFVFQKWSFLKLSGDKYLVLVLLKLNASVIHCKIDRRAYKLKELDTHPALFYVLWDSFSVSRFSIESFR